MGKLIVIEGTDGSGKQTQSDLLYNYFKNEENKNVIKLTFPDYDSETSVLVKMYLAGKFGDNANSVDPKVASVFYAVDRYASYKTKWEAFSKEKDNIIIFDRYVTSNMIHQAAKIEDIDKKNEYLDWIYDFEYNIMGLPKPDKVVFLNMRFDLAQKLMENRANKITNSRDKDIHERDICYMKKCYENACFVSNKYNWNEIKCFDGDYIRTIEDIQKEIRNVICN